ncbi:MAG TPA: hypothetical protein VLG40_03760 [Candidatus Saccharimonas sp.]|nr:hypothetical protein [Candidatus Saccharimonas sp.]
MRIVDIAVALTIQRCIVVALLVVCAAALVAAIVAVGLPGKHPTSRNLRHTILFVSVAIAAALVVCVMANSQPLLRDWFAVCAQYSVIGFIVVLLFFVRRIRAWALLTASGWTEAQTERAVDYVVRYYGKQTMRLELNVSAHGVIDLTVYADGIVIYQLAVTLEDGSRSTLFERLMARYGVKKSGDKDVVCLALYCRQRKPFRHAIVYDH